VTIDRLVGRLWEAGLSPTAEELAEALWLARFLSAAPGQPTAEAPAHPEPPPEEGLAMGGAATAPVERSTPDLPPRPAAGVGMYLPVPDRAPADRTVIRAPTVPAIPHQLQLLRALRPLRQRLLSNAVYAVDEIRTATATADAGTLIPVLRPIADRRLDLALVVDDSASMVIWSRTAAELRTLLERLGAFRDIQVWRMNSDHPNGRAGLRSPVGSARNSAAELIDPAGRRAILVLSDCIGAAWLDGSVGRWLEDWSTTGPVAIVQPLPQRLWDRCGPAFVPVQFQPLVPGHGSSRLVARPLSETYLEVAVGTPVPVVAIEPRWFGSWARLMAGRTATGVHGIALYTRTTDRAGPGSDGVRRGRTTADDRPAALVPEPTPEELVHRFRATASPEARFLAAYLSASPLNLPVMRLVQHAMMPDSNPSHLAEVFLSGLLVRASDDADPTANPDEVRYDFQPGVRPLLATALTRRDALAVLTAVSTFIESNLGSPVDFPAFLTGDPPRMSLAGPFAGPFARVAVQVLRSLGGSYSEAADRLSDAAEATTDDGSVRLGLPDTATARHPAAEGGRAGSEPAAVVISTEVLDELRRRLPAGRTAVVAVTGPAGIGKSTILRAYLERYRSQYQAVWWIPATHPARIRAALAELAAALGLVPAQDQAVTVDRVLDAIRDVAVGRRWLLIYDGAEAYDEIAPYLPAAGHVLVASRNPQWRDHAEPFDVHRLDLGGGVALLRHRLDARPAELEPLARELGGNPQVMRLIAAWIHDVGVPADEALDRIRRAGGGAEAAVDIAIADVYARRPDAAELLDRCAVLAEGPIERPLRQPIVDAHLSAAVTYLSRLGFLDTGTGAVALVGSVRQAVRRRLTAERVAAVRGWLRRTLGGSSGEAAGGLPEGLGPQSIPHILALDPAAAQPPGFQELVLDQIRAQYAIGDYDSGTALATRMCARWLAEQDAAAADAAGFTPADQIALRAALLMAAGLRARGSTTQAWEATGRALARARSGLAAGDPDRLAATAAAAIDARLTGDFAAALRYDEEVATARLDLLGRADPGTVDAVAAVAADLRLLDRFGEAHHHDRIAFGAAPMTSRGATAIAWDLYGLARYDEAVDTATAPPTVAADPVGRAGLDRVRAAALRAAGQPELAREYAERAYRSATERLGANNPTAASAAITFANALFAAGQPQAASVLAEIAVRAFEQALGENHPATVATAGNLDTIRLGTGGTGLDTRLQEIPPLGA
jgi:tetratricopeptide (TPR) repeat protein